MSDIDKHGDGDPYIEEFELCHNPEEVLRIGRDFQRQDTFRGAQHDTAKLLCDTIEYLGDRLSKTVGNAAAMREALDAINRIETRRLKYLLMQLVEADIYDGGLINKTISAIEKARLALSAPARNCDRPECATSKAAQDVWLKEDGGKTPYYEWLLAPAAELKG